MNFKKINSILIAIAVIGFMGSASCNSPSQKVKDADNNVTQAKLDLVEAQSEYADEVANFKKETDEKITTNEKTIADIKARMAKDKESAKAEYKKQISVLEQKNSDLKKRMDDYKEDGKEKWQTFKTEFNHDMDELGNSIKNLNNEK